MKKSTLILTLMVFSTIVNAAADEKTATQQVSKILDRCEEHMKLGNLKSYSQCAVRDIKKLANQGNFAAQYQLGEWADLDGNHEEALAWFQKGKDNPTTPQAVKAEHQDRLQELLNSSTQEYQ